MKFLETHFEDYVQSSEANNLQTKLNKVYKAFPSDIKDLKNCIFYGPLGAGKYTQVLRFIKPYSLSNLKYEKKMIVTFNKNQYYFKISDIHIEVDMDLLGCNSKVLWNEIYMQILDVAAAKPNNTHIIVCKNFQEIHGELLEDFYSYMQTTKYNSIKLIYFIISEQISFIPDNIVNNCKLIPIVRPSKSKINSCFNKKIKLNISEITNLKNLRPNITQLMNPHFLMCNKIINLLINIEEINFVTFRDNLYDIFIYNINIYESVWYIVSSLINDNYIKHEDVSDLMVKTYSFFKYFNNNYRPIYHLENYMFYLIKKIHGI